MEKCSTSMSKARSSSPKEEEESGWTFYFEDFLSCNITTTNDNIDQQQHSSNDQRSSSFNSKKLLGSFKKRRSSTSNYKAAAADHIVDDALEDTATSPANSPKLVCYLNQQFTNRKEREFTQISEQRAAGGTTSAGRTVDERTTELKKRGLCLVPVSTFANYLGHSLTKEK